MIGTGLEQGRTTEPGSLKGQDQLKIPMQTYSQKLKTPLLSERYLRRADSFLSCVNHQRLDKSMVTTRASYILAYYLAY